MADSNLGVRLRAFRMKKKLSLQQLADKIGASKAHIWDLEQGNTKNPSLGLLTELSKALEVPIKDLIGESSETVDAESPVRDDDETLRLVSVTWCWPPKWSK